MKLKYPKYVYYIYQFGKLDCVSFTRSNAEEMAEAPDEQGRKPFQIERWKFNKGRYEFDRKIKWE